MNDYIAMGNNKSMTFDTLISLSKGRLDFISNSVVEIVQNELGRSDILSGVSEELIHNVFNDIRRSRSRPVDNEEVVDTLTDETIRYIAYDIISGFRDRKMMAARTIWVVNDRSDTHGRKMIKNFNGNNELFSEPRF